jgi:hypothetical protein
MKRKLPSLIHGRSQIRDQLFVEEIERWICEGEQAQSTSRFETHLIHDFSPCD